MSSEYSIHLGDKPAKGHVYDLGGLSGVMVTVEVKSLGNTDTEVRLFLTTDRLLEVSLLFHKIALDLAALLPDAEEGDSIPIGEATEHAEPPHRWG